MEKKNYSVIYRAIHWLMVLGFFMVLLTVFLRMTWLNRVDIADIIRNFLSDKGETLSDGELVTLSKQIRRPMWRWHIYSGLFLTGLFIIRFILPFLGKIKFQSPFKSNLTSIQKFQRWVYIIFYVCVVICIITGVLTEYVPKSNPIRKTAKSIHIQSLYFIIPYIVIHLFGVIKAEFSKERGIISRIVNGGDKTL